MVNEIKLQEMTPEELRAHIKQCEAILESKKNERWCELTKNVIKALSALKYEFPTVTIETEAYCEGCQERIEVSIDIEDLLEQRCYPR